MSFRWLLVIVAIFPILLIYWIASHQESHYDLLCFAVRVLISLLSPCFLFVQIFHVYFWYLDLEFSSRCCCPQWLVALRMHVGKFSIAHCQYQKETYLGLFLLISWKWSIVEYVMELSSIERCSRNDLMNDVEYRLITQSWYMTKILERLSWCETVSGQFFPYSLIQNLRATYIYLVREWICVVLNPCWLIFDGDF